MIKGITVGERCRGTPFGRKDAGEHITIGAHQEEGTIASPFRVCHHLYVNTLTLPVFRSRSNTESLLTHSFKDPDHQRNFEI